ncbi:10261_t:CDS:1, partial [Funneliformis geosporum]
LSVMKVKQDLVVTYKMLSNLAKIDTHKLKTGAIKQLIDK